VISRSWLDITRIEEVKPPFNKSYLTLDLTMLTIDAVSLCVLLLTLFIGRRAVRAFRQSKQAVTESASLLGVVVNALTSRIQVSESVVDSLRLNMDTLVHRNTGMETEQTRLGSNYLTLLHYMHEALDNDRRLILQLEQIKTRLASIPQNQRQQRDIITRNQPQTSSTEQDVFSSLTPTEREIVEILAREGPKAAPDLGHRLKKSREHIARLMKKLYFEGYVDRESNRSPFKYTLNDKVRPGLGLTNESVTEKLPGSA